MVLRIADNRIGTKCPVFTDVRAIFIDASTIDDGDGMHRAEFFDYVNVELMPHGGRKSFNTKQLSAMSLACSDRACSRAG